MNSSTPPVPTLCHNLRCANQSTPGKLYCWFCFELLRSKLCERCRNLERGKAMASNVCDPCINIMVEYDEVARSVPPWAERKYHYKPSPTTSASSSPSSSPSSSSS
jgi:hypothetical protein